MNDLTCCAISDRSYPWKVPPAPVAELGSKERLAARLEWRLGGRAVFEAASSPERDERRAVLVLFTQPLVQAVCRRHPSSCPSIGPYIIIFYSVICFFTENIPHLENCTGSGGLETSHFLSLTAGSPGGSGHCCNRIFCVIVPEKLGT